MKKILIRIVIIAILCTPFLIYPYMRVQKDRQDQTIVETQGIEAESGQSDSTNDDMKITWETIALLGIAGGAGALRYRHAKQMRQSVLDEWQKKTGA